jgi:hypothetical protein
LNFKDRHGNPVGDGDSTDIVDDIDPQFHIPGVPAGVSPVELPGVMEPIVPHEIPGVEEAEPAAVMLVMVPSEVVICPI